MGYAKNEWPFNDSLGSSNVLGWWMTLSQYTEADVLSVSYLFSAVSYDSLTCIPVYSHQIVLYLSEFYGR